MEPRLRAKVGVVKLATSNVGEVGGRSKDWLQLMCCAPTRVRSSISEGRSEDMKSERGYEVGARIQKRSLS